MIFEVSGYELKISSRRELKSIWLSVKALHNEFYIDIDNIGKSLPLSKKDVVNISYLKTLVSDYRSKRKSINDIIYYIDKSKNKSEFFGNS